MFCLDGTVYTATATANSESTVLLSQESYRLNIVGLISHFLFINEFLAWLDVARNCVDPYPWCPEIMRVLFVSVR